VELPDGHVKDVRADRGGDGHVAEALPGHDDARDQVRDGGAGSQEGQAHHLRIEAVTVFYKKYFLANAFIYTKNHTNIVLYFHPPPPPKKFLPPAGFEQGLKIAEKNDRNIGP
jgi:hypothetical protein